MLWKKQAASQNHLPQSTKSYKESAAMEVCCRSRLSSSPLLSNPVSSTADERRPPAYNPTPWDYASIQSLDRSHHHPSTKVNEEEEEELEEQVRQLLKMKMGVGAKVEVVDTVERLGLRHKFRAEIEDVLQVTQEEDQCECDSYHLLHHVALRFTLLRRHSIFVSQEVFRRFMDESGRKFEECLVEDVKGMVGLYEASFLGWEGEEVMDEAREFTTFHLKRIGGGGGAMADKVKRVLELPLHWTPLRLQARWFIDSYEQEHHSCNSSLLKLAKMEFNRVQSLHHKELADLSRWSVQTGMNKLPFARNCLIECYMWSCLMTDDPKYQNIWTPASKIGVVSTLVDDVFDAYGSEEELEHFTQMVKRWSLGGIEKLPTEIQIVFLAMFNTTNDICFDILKERGFNCISHLSKMWATLCEAYLKEAKWCSMGSKPSLEEYIANGIITSGYPLILSISNLVVKDSPTTDIIKNIEHPIIQMAGILGRILNDLGTCSAELARGDNLKLIQCYMIENMASEEDAREHLKGRVVESWKKANKCLFEKECSVGEPFFSLAMGICRGGHFFYQSGDGYGDSQSLAKEYITHILINPIPIS